MGNYLLKFVIKCKWLIILGLVLGSLTGLFSLAVLRVIDKFIPAYSSLMAGRLGLRVSFRRAHYVFPRKIIIDDVKVFDKQTDAKAMLESPRMTLGFSFPLFSSQKKIRLSQLTLNHLKIRAPDLGRYMMRHGGLVAVELKVQPQLDMQIRLTEAQLYLFRDSRVVAPIVFDMDLSLDRGQFLAKLKDRHSFLQFWGDRRGPELDWKGFMFYGEDLMLHPLSILDIAGHLRFRDKGVTLERLSFSTDDAKVLAHASCWVDGPLKFDAALSYDRQDGHVNAQDPLRKIAIDLHGQLDHRGVLTSGDMDIDLFSKRSANMSLQKFGLAFEDLGAQVINDRLLKLKMRRAAVLLRTFGSEHKISFENLLTSIQRPTDAQFKMTLSAGLYGGSYQGLIVEDIASHPWQTKARGSFDKIDISRLSEIWEHFEKYHGQATGTFYFRASRSFSLTGSLSVHGGRFQDLDFLPWDVPKIFQMPSLDHLSGADLFCHLRFEPQSIEFRDVALRADDLDVNGFFRVDPDDLVSSEIAIRFSQQLFGESPIGQKILKLVPRA
jgi:hypothetical protein